MSSRTSGKDLARSVTRVESELVDDPATAAARATTPSGPEAAFAAQIIGQGGQRNGIRGGPPVMDGARSAYLGTEYSGDKERRPPIGKTKSTDI
ncbi:hypothetical protein BH10PSE2_BH10PSE2_06710 [soil metagenome]